jgi:hypothetical protein
MGIYNPFSEKHVHRVWGTPHKAEKASKWIERTGYVSLLRDSIA